jgi:hypothetical protein
LKSRRRATSEPERRLPPPTANQGAIPIFRRKA